MSWNAKFIKVVSGSLLLVLFLAVTLLSFTLLGPVLFGFEVRTVTGGSMAPAIPRGSLAVVSQVDSENIEVGDVIAYRRSNDTKLIITHRVVEVQQRLRGLGFLTKGDANETRDAGIVPSRMVLGKVVAHVPWLGRVAGFLRTPLGFLVFLVAPATVLAWHELRNIISLIREKRRALVSKTFPVVSFNESEKKA